ALPAASNCTAITAGPPANTIDVIGLLNAGTPVTAQPVAITPGQSQVFAVTVPLSVTNADLIYIELDRAIELEVLPAAYTSVIYSSNSPALFASGRFGIQSVALSAGAA